MARRREEEDTTSPSLELDDWQREVLETEGNICLCTGRQVGKSTVISMRAGEYAINHPKKSILIIAAVERQALLLFEKVLSYIHDKDKRLIKKGKDKPTKHTLKLVNGSVIHCLPTGLTGYGIRGYTIDDLYADEAHFIPDEVWSAVIPMLATTGGRINLLSTPDLTKGKDGYFYRASMDEKFKFFSISTQEVAEKRKEPQRSNMLKMIEDSRQWLNKKEFAAEFMGQFVDAMMQVFSNQWIDRVCTKKTEEKTKKNTFMGVDIAGMGEDASTFEILKKEGNHLIQIHHSQTTKTRTTETEENILRLDSIYNPVKIGIDDGGMGVGVYDHLLRSMVKRKIVALNNAKRSLEQDKRKRLLKEDMYYNLLAMGERGEVILLDNDEIKASLRSIHVDEDGKINGQNNHIAEGLIRAAWLAKDKNLNIWIDSIKV